MDDSQQSDNPEQINFENFINDQSNIEDSPQNTNQEQRDFEIFINELSKIEDSPQNNSPIQSDCIFNNISKVKTNICSKTTIITVEPKNCNKCPICQEYINPTILDNIQTGNKCKCQYHERCFRVFKYKSKICALCRKPLD